MDERTRLWQEIGLGFLLRTPVIALKPNATGASGQNSGSPVPTFSESSSQGISYPEPLLFYRQRLSPPMVAIITYPQLDQDFRGQPDDLRLRLIHAIVEKATPWSIEEVAFLPSAVYRATPVSNEVLENFFLDVVAEFKPKFVLDFGGCVESLFTNRNHSVHRETIDDSLTRHVLLPNLDDMLPDNKFVKKTAWDIIRGLTL